MPQTSKLNWLKKSTLDLIDSIALRHHVCNLCLRASESSRTLHLPFLSLVNYNAATEMMAPEDLSYNGFGAEDSHFLGLALLSGYHWLCQLCLHAEKQAAKRIVLWWQPVWPRTIPSSVSALTLLQISTELMTHRITCFAFMLVWHFWCTCRILLANGIFWPKLETSTLEHAGFGFCSWTFNSHETVIFRFVVARQAYD